jgi:hypothetical protein
MPEGLSPIEAGKQLHEHHQEPHDPARPTGGDRHARIVQIGEALLLSLVTIAAAWSGYAAAKWGTESSIELARSATLRNPGLPRRPRRAVHPQLRLVHVQCLVHRVHLG